MPDRPQELDTSRPHPARMYDYYLGGKNHFAADRETAKKILTSLPGARIGSRAKTVPSSAAQSAT